MAGVTPNPAVGRFGHLAAPGSWNRLYAGGTIQYRPALIMSDLGHAVEEAWAQIKKKKKHILSAG